MENPEMIENRGLDWCFKNSLNHQQLIYICRKMNKVH